MSTTDLDASNSNIGASATEEVTHRLELPADQWRQAANDLIRGVRAYEAWSLLGWHDIRQRYRRSKLGPFWITITMGVAVGSIGLIFGALFGQPMREFMPFVAAGMVVWALLSTFMTDGCVTFTGEERIIRQIKLPYSLHIFRMAWRTLISFAHNIWVFVAVMIIFAAWPNRFIWLAIPGLVLIVANGLWIGLVLSIASARFRDIPLIVTSALQLLYLTTPIIWLPNSLRGRHTIIYEYNPLYHLLELVRAPLLGNAPTLANWTVGIAAVVLGWSFAFFIFARLRWRIPYWI